LLYLEVAFLGCGLRLLFGLEPSPSPFAVRVTDDKPFFTSIPDI
jgi:hypothetical protein